MRAIELHADIPGQRRELRLQVGSVTVAVIEISGRDIADREWRAVQLARRSFPAMWGCGELAATFAEDAFDGRGGNASLYDTRHYLAWVRDGGGPTKLVTARKVILRADALDAERRANAGDLLPADFRYWRVRTTGGYVPLWDLVKAYARNLAPDDASAELRVASMGRVATFPYGRRQTAAQRENTAIAWAAIQLLAARDDGSLLYVRTIRPGFQDRVLVVRDADGKTVRPPFVRTEDVLGLPPGSVGLDNDAALVREHKLAAPGYFIDSADAARILAELLDEGSLTLVDLRPAIGRLIKGESAGTASRMLLDLGAPVGPPDHVQLAEVLTRPRTFKYLIPLLGGVDRLSRMPGDELRRRLVEETRDGPFSAALLPDSVVAGAQDILEAAERKRAVSAIPTLSTDTDAGVLMDERQRSRSVSPALPHRSDIGPVAAWRSR